MTSSLLSPDFIACDTRDPKYIYNEIRTIYKTPAQRVTLHAGDYGSITNKNKSWRLERKEANDYLSCLTTGALYDQMAKFVGSADLTFLLPEGQLIPSADGTKIRVARGQREWNYMAVYHSWIELAGLGVIILPFVPAKYTAKAIVQLHETLNNGCKYIVEKNRAPLTLANAGSPVKRFLAPMIGGVTLANLGQQYPNVWSLFQGVMEEPEKLRSVPRVGPGTVDKIRKLLLGRLK